MTGCITWRGAQWVAVAGFFAQFALRASPAGFARIEPCRPELHHRASHGIPELALQHHLQDAIGALQQRMTIRHRDAPYSRVAVPPSGNAPGHERRAGRRPAALPGC